MTESIIKQLLELYAEGKATEEQRQLVEAYLDFHQRHSPDMPWDEEAMKTSQRIMENIQREWEAMRASEHAEAASQEALPVERRWMIRRYAGIAAAGVFVTVGIGLLWKGLRPTQKTAPQEAPSYRLAEAGAGKIVHLLLPDSSEVWLNAGARLRYPEKFDGRLRHLELLDGEAFFQVHPDANRLFDVQTPHLLIKVLGTSFDAKAYAKAQQENVAVVTGKVAVVPEGAAAATKILLPSQQVNYETGSGRVHYVQPAFDQLPKWRSGAFSFYEESFGDIAIELEHRFNVRIDFKYPGLKKYHISADFQRSDDVQDILSALCILNQNHVRKMGHQYYVIQ